MTGSRFALVFKTAWRNVRRQRRRAWLAALSAGVGASIMIISLGLLRASREGLMENLRIVQTGDIQVRNRIPGAVYGLTPEPVGVPWELGLDDSQRLCESLAAHPEVAAVTRRIALPCAYLAKGQVLYRGVVFGIEIQSEARLREILPPKEGSFLSSEQDFSIYLGSEPADRLGVHNGDAITLLCRAADGSDVAEELAVTGIFETGPPWQAFFCFVNLDTLQELVTNGDGTVQDLKVFLKHPSRAKEMAPVIREIAENITGRPMDVHTFKQLGRFYSGMTTANSFLLATMIGALAIVIGANLMNTLLTAVFERRREIGLVRAIGGSRSHIIAEILIEGLCMTLPASLAGAIIGLGSCLLINGLHVSIQEPAFALMTGSPFLTTRVGWIEILSVVIVITVLGVASAVLPAWTSARMLPVKALKDL